MVLNGKVPLAPLMQLGRPTPQASKCDGIFVRVPDGDQCAKRNLCLCSVQVLLRMYLKSTKREGKTTIRRLAFPIQSKSHSSLSP
jgi:hypothetical protein